MQRARHLLTAAAALAALGTLLPQAARPLGTVRIAGGLTRPVYVTAPAGDHRLFILEQHGVIKIWELGQVLPQPFLDITDRVSNISGYSERGLLGLAFHPDYPDSGVFFVNYTDLGGDTRVSRFHVTADPDVADPDSEELILFIDQPYGNHNGGMLAFGPTDRYLYIATGDGGSAGDPLNNGQRLDTLLGKILRIDVIGGQPYLIPPDNPFAGDPLARDEIWAYGLRNPWRFSFDAQTSDVYIGDVGQNEWEEVDFQPAASTGGENYGWRLMEGNHCYNPPVDCNDGTLVLPIHEYGHVSGRCTVVGGYVYRGAQIPEIQGTYVFADWCSGEIWSFRYDGNQITDFQDRTSELAPGGGFSIDNPSSFGEDGFGELYIVDYTSGSTGEVYRIVSDPSSVDGSQLAAPRLRLDPPEPNPFSERTRFGVMLDRPGRLDLRVVDPRGRTVVRLAQESHPQGSRRFVWDGRDASGRRVPGGVYFLRASLDGWTASRTVHLIR